MQYIRNKQLGRVLNSEELKLRESCRAKFYRAIKKGTIIRPEVCSKCGKNPNVIQGHHPDYERPLDVMWLCRDCHHTIHNAINDGKRDAKSYDLD